MFSLGRAYAGKHHVNRECLIGCGHSGYYGPRFVCSFRTRSRRDNGNARGDEGPAIHVQLRVTPVPDFGIQDYLSSFEGTLIGKELIAIKFHRKCRTIRLMVDIIYFTRIRNGP